MPRKMGRYGLPGGKWRKHMADDRAKYETSGDQKFVDKANRRGKVGWDVGKHIEVIPHFRRPHMTLVWTGPAGRFQRLCPGGAASCIGRPWKSCRVGLGRVNSFNKKE